MVRSLLTKVDIANIDCLDVRRDCKDFTLGVAAKCELVIFRTCNRNICQLLGCTIFSLNRQLTNRCVHGNRRVGISVSVSGQFFDDIRSTGIPLNSTHIGQRQRRLCICCNERTVSNLEVFRTGGRLDAVPLGLGVLHAFISDNKGTIGDVNTALVFLLAVPFA